MAATTLQGGAGNEIVVPEDVPVAIAQPSEATGGAAIVEVLGTASELQVAVGGEAPVEFIGATVKNSSVTAVAPAGETAQISFETKTVTKTKITSSGEGAVEVEVSDGKFKKSEIDFSSSTADDSIGFGEITVTKATITLGDGGKDTVTFSDGIKLKGNTKIRTGTGKDTIEVPSNPKGKGTISISNFEKKDKLMVDGEKMKGKKIYNGKKDIPDYIGIQFTDGEVVLGS
jgi:hypothetical protein